ncbi:MAG TPA: response regulator, partial [Methanoregula sp.]|nr:response regulator [Methanoregula sp.]
MIRILYVDDEPTILDTTRRILEKQGSFTVTCALSGKDALEQIRTTPFDIVVADYQMEDITGLDLLRIIRNENDAMPFIIFTGRGREEIVIEAFENGVDFYVQKGGDARSQYAELAHKIEQAVESRKIRKRLARSEEKFSKFLQDFDGIAFQINPSGRFFLLEGTVEETTGYPRSEFLSDYISLEGIIHPDEKRRFLDDMQHLATQPGYRVDSIFRIIRKDGHTRWLHGMLHNICTKQ